MNLTNLCGDITGTTDNTGLPTAASDESTEYGAPRDPATTPDTFQRAGTGACIEQWPSAP